MNCKHCGAELPEGTSVCPGCGEVNEAPAVTVAEEATQKKSPVMVPLRMVLAIFAVVVLVAALVTVVILGTSGGNDATDPTVTEAPATIPTDGNPDDETCKGTYTVTDDVLTAQLDTVVATIGDYQLDNGMLQVYYWNQVYDFLNYVGSYAIYFGLDYTQPMDTQVYSETGTTWQQYFLSESLYVWHQFTALADAAEKAGFQLDTELQASLDSFESELDTQAAESGYASGQDMLVKLLGPGCTVADYKDYLYRNYLGYTYLQSLAEAKEVTMDDINAYYAENEETYKTLKESGSKSYDVRHILLFPGGVEKDEYTEDDWTAGLAAAEALLQQWRDGEATEESFAQLAKEHSGDSNAEDGGIYTGLTSSTNFVTEFKEWYLDESRQVGDTGIVKTEYGYHLMYFSASEEEWITEVRSQILSDYQNGLVTDAMEANPMEVTYSDIVLGFVDLGASE